MDTGLKDGENAENQVIPPVEETTIMTLLSTQNPQQ